MNSNLNLHEAHNQWATRPEDERFRSLEDLTASVKARRMRSRSADAVLTKLNITADGGEVIVNGEVNRATPSHWAFGQLANSLGAPASYLRTLPAPLAATCLMNGVEKAQRDKLKFMSLENEATDVRTLQAVTSPTYGRIWDADVADLAGRIVERTGGRFHNPIAYKKGMFGNPNATEPAGLYASDRDIFIFMIDGGSLLEIGPRAQLNRGFFLWNSEVGSRTFGLTTFLFNVVCGNHIVWGAQDVNRFVVRHTKNGPYRFDSEAVPQLLSYVNASSKPIEDAIRRAAELSIAKNLGLAPGERLDADKIGMFAMTRAAAKFTKSEIRGAIEAAENEEGQCETLWDLVQGFTAYARGFDYLDARTDLETRAGKLLDLVKE